MPVDYQQIQAQVKSLGQQALQQEKLFQVHREQALGLLNKYTDSLDELRLLVERASREAPGLRCALPVTEALTSSMPAPELKEEIVILAADGSQINPDRHAAVEFGLVNTGAIRIQPGQPIPPTETIRSRLLYGEELRPKGFPLSEETIALLRDLAERVLLAELAALESLPVITLTDGPLELFREQESGAARLYQAYFGDYLGALETLASLSAVAAGYVDRPRADLVVRLLELTLLPDADLAQKAGREHPLQGATDASLYEQLLAPGERSPIYALQSPTALEFKGLLSLHFFYINVGREDQPSLARVEIPAWVMQHPILLNRLHAALVNQCRVIEAHPFPYALHRAHEVAVVTHAEKSQLDGMIMKALYEQGFPTLHVSNKQFLKDKFGKLVRYK